MNLDTSIYRMAFREADTLGVAQVLVAKKRADLEHQMLLKQINRPLDQCRMSTMTATTTSARSVPNPKSRPSNSERCAL